MAEKMTRRELRSPDKFTRATSGWLARARENPRETAIAVGGLLLVLVIVGFLVDRGGIRVDPVAGGALSEALALVDRPVGEAEAAEGEEAFATEEERRTALADVRFDQGDYDAALSLYEAFLSKAGSDHSLRVLALEGKAVALEAKGDLEGALAGFEALIQAGAEGKGLYGKARLLERQQKWDEARAAWEKLKEEHGLTPEGREANQRLARLDLLRPHGASEG